MAAAFAWGLAAAAPPSSTASWESIVLGPEAFEHGGKLVDVVTTFGFALAFAISSL